MTEFDTQDLGPVTHIGKQADDIIEEETEWVDLIDSLDISRYESQDGVPEWHDATPFRRMFFAYIWAKSEKISLTTIPEKLDSQHELATTMGFDVGDFPSTSTFKPVRLEENRFEGLQSTVENAAKEIRKIAAERGAPIGCDLVKSADSADDKIPSNRTVQRMLRGKGKEVLDELKSVAIPSVDLPRPDDPIYEDGELLVLEAIAAISRIAANDAGKNLGDIKNPDPDIDDPFYEDGPTGETLLDAFKKMSVDQIATVINFTLNKTYTRAKPRLRELESNNGSRFGARAKVAIDITYVAYYGDRDEMEWVQGAPDDKGYNWCHKYATAVIVGDNTHYVVGVCPLGSTEYADTDEYSGKDRSYYVGDVARRLLSIAEEYVNIRMVYADREFHSVDVINTLELRNLNYVIPAVKDRHRVGKICDRFDRLKRGYDEKNDTPLYVKEDHVMHGRAKGGPSNSKVSPNLVVLPPDEDDDANKEGSPQPFVTNLDVNDEIALDRRWAKKQVEEYSDRGGIENSYSSIKEAAASTTSKEFEVRWFHFAFGCVVYNMWLLVDFLTQERIGVIETRKKPRISLSRFLNWIEKELVRLL